MNSLKSLIAGFLVFAVVAGIAAVPADAATNPSLKALDAKIAEAQRLLQQLRAQPGIDPKVVRVVEATLGSGMKRRNKFVIADRLYLSLIVRNRVANARVEKLVRLYNAVRSRLSAAQAAKARAAIRGARAAIARDTAKLKQMFPVRQRDLASQMAWFDKFNLSLRGYMQKASPVT